MLWLQGRSISAQPKVSPGSDNNNNVLLWNGDVFSGPLADKKEGDSDTDAVFEALEAASDEDIPRLFSSVRGPYAFAYLRPESNKIWFGRDVLGRHCLLVGGDGNSDFFLSSVVDKGFGKADCAEVPATGVFESTLGEENGGTRPILHPWRSLDKQEEACEGEMFGYDKGGDPLDCAIELPTLHQEEVAGRDEWVESAVKEKWPTDKIVRRFLEEEEDEAKQLVEVLEEAVRIRVEQRPEYCKQCIKRKLMDEDVTCGHAKVAVLYSGGVDSAVVAALADSVMPVSEPLDLINVAFETGKGDFDVPDRLTARQAYEELLATAKGRGTEGRRIGLVEVNVTREELRAARAQTVSGLMAPSADSVLDDSIGCALWFAARGAGRRRVKGEEETHDYICPARVLLLGTGADEQLAGYSRHRTVFGSGGGPAAVAGELRLELRRLWRRNMGRDNRVVASHGVAPRYPFLDEAVVNFLSSLPSLRKADLRLPRGAGEKALLRASAMLLGLDSASTRPKRAIQFGSRIAKMEVRKEKGHQVAVRE